MVDGTPVLDIKPYIPQYDYPGIAYLNIRENYDQNNILPNVSNYVTGSNSENSNHVENMSERIMDGEENGHIQNILPPENSR